MICGAGLVGGLAFPLGTAHADPNPVYPSADQVKGAQAAASAAAGSVADLDRRLAASRSRMADLQQAAGDAAELANGAQVALDAATAASADAKGKADAAQAKADEASLVLSRYAAEVYQGGGDTSQLNVFFGGGGPAEVLDRAAGVDAVGAERARMVQEADSARYLAQNLRQQSTEAEARRADAAAAATAAAQKAMTAAKDAETQTVQLQAQQQDMTAQLATLQNTSVQLEQQRQAGIAAEEERQREEANRRAAEAAAAAAAQKAAQEEAARVAAAAAAEAAARTARQEAAAAKAAADAQAKKQADAAAAAAAQAAQAAADQAAAQAAARAAQAAASAPRTPTKPSSSAPVVSAPVSVPAPSGGVAAVIAFARAQLGKPYVWGGAGPNVWDCSGLTMMAWRQVGVSLNHYTGDQYDETTHIPISQLQPGDLVFYGTSGSASHHVGLYIGGGMMIHAPNPSTVVKIASIYSMSDLVPMGGRPS